MRCKVSVSIDGAGPIIVVSSHYNAPVPAPISPYLEPPYPMYWYPGFRAGQNKFAAKVKHRDSMIVQQGHDMGWLEPHIGPPAGAGLALLKSSRKVNFSASSVRMGGAPAGVVDLLSGAPMTICGDPVSLPDGHCENDFSNVFVGMSLADFAAGQLSMVAGLGSSMFGSEFNTEWGDSAKKLFAAVAAAAAGAARVLLTGQGQIGIKLGTPPLAISFGINFDGYKPTSGSVSFGPSSVSVDKDGKVKTTGGEEQGAPYQTPETGAPHAAGQGPAL